MAVLDSIAKQANRLASDVQMSLRRARVEGERRLLQRQHRAALEELGERAYELVRDGTIPGEALSTEIESLRTEDDEGTGQGAETPREDPSRTAFPMVDSPPSTPPTPGPGWEAADKFFGKGSGKN
jgi:hypothetical protein